MVRDDSRRVDVRTATPEDLVPICNVLDGATLEIKADVVRAAIDRNTAFVAESDRSTILGTLVLDGDEITHVAVRRRRRGQGIGTALVAAATEATEAETLVARFDPSVRPFYEKLGFDVECAADDRRYVGRLDADGPIASNEWLDDIATGGE